MARHIGVEHLLKYPPAVVCDMVWCGMGAGV